MTTITGHTIRTNWKAAFFAGLGLMLVALLFASLHDQMKGDLHTFTDLVPAGMEAVIGNLANAATPEGWLSIELFALFLPLALSILGVTIGARIIGKEEDSGTLELLLCRPISRHRIIAEKAVALCIILALPLVMIWFSLLLGKMVFPFDVNLVRVAEAALSAWLLGLSFGMLTFFVQALTGKRGLAIAIGTGALGMSWMLNVIAKLVSLVENLQYASPLYYYNNPNILLHGINLGYAGILLAIALSCYALAHLGFAKRDINA